ncbi:MAG: aminoglycoside phosphotransferase family protein [Myxococcales bacterium]|nr:aminoglycoside phosphotransferase family protein [Myxococcales bacterium]
MEGWHRWARATLGRAVEPRPAAREGVEARVWQLCAEGQVIAYLKQHRVSDKWRRERAILEQLARPPAAPVPVVLGAEPAQRVLLLSVLDGAPAEAVRTTAAQRRALHTQAGRLRRRLDAVPVDEPDPTPLPEAIARRQRAWGERARPHLPAALLARVRRAFEVACFEGQARRWCHRDLAPHNWLYDPGPGGPRLGVVDFGQARPDDWLVDVLKLWDRSWVQQPDLADAFWAGYGRRLDPAEVHRLRQLALLHGLATATWGHRHGDRALAEHGHATLERALGEVEADAEADA